MNDQSDRREDLIEEIAILRRRISELEHAEAERKRVEDGLRESEGKFRDLAEKAIIGIYLIQDGVLKYANSEFAAIFGYECSDMAFGLNVTDLVHPDDLPRVRRTIRDRIDGKNKSVRYAFRILRKNGEARHAAVYSSRTSYQGKTAIIGTVLDVTEIMETEKALRNRESYLTSIIENLPGLVWLKDKHGRYLAANEAFVLASGRRSAEEIVGRTDAEIFPAGLAEMYHQTDMTVMETGEPVMMERPVFRNGETHWQEVFNAPVRDESGAVIGTTGYARDITERIHAVEALRQSEEKHRTILESIDEAYVEIGLAGNVTFCSDPACRITGYSRHELMTMNYRQYTSPKTARMMRVFFGRIYRTGEKSQIGDFEIIGKDGNVRLVEMTVNIKRNAAGECSGFRYIARDITERKRAEEELRESRQRLAQIIAFLPDATFVIDTAGKVIFWNRAMEEMTGVKAEKMIGKSDYEYALPFYGKRRPMLIDLALGSGGRVAEWYDTVVRRENDILVNESWVPRFKGDGGYVWGNASPLYDGRGHVIGAIESLRDITDRKLAEEMLKSRGLELEKKTREQEDLNTALRVLLDQRANDKNELEEQIVANIKVLVQPQIEKLKEKLDGRVAMLHVKLLEEKLKEIVSPFVRKLSSKYMNLTNRELQIAALIEEGKVTKEITKILGISEGSVNIHRYSIRKKLKLTKKHNLRAYLSSLRQN